jgi:hypothetical protein
MYGLYPPGLCPSYDGWMVYLSYPNCLKVIAHFKASLLFLHVIFFSMSLKFLEKLMRKVRLSKKFLEYEIYMYEYLMNRLMPIHFYFMYISDYCPKKSLSPHFWPKRM